MDRVIVGIDMEKRTGSPDLDAVREIIDLGLRDYQARLFLYGSWAGGTASRTSDIDVAVLPRKPIPPSVLAEIREALEESSVLYPVDLVDLSCCPDSFRERVLREGIPWNE
ncbi:MAG: nucleotidyltransferase domain-containing protein [Acidobacteria bacterium]|nr:nucleotidyltransferase domain-containing protein [Acidobacteriota bacterium]